MPCGRGGREAGTWGQRVEELWAVTGQHGSHGCEERGQGGLGAAPNQALPHAMGKLATVGKGHEQHWCLPDVLE